MKFNWGTGIVLVFILFFAAIAFILIFPFNQKVDLVTDDYYQKELKYQDQIDRSSRAKLLTEEILLTQNRKTLDIIFPKSYGSISGEIMFYRPSDLTKDFISKIKTDAGGRQTIGIGELAPGLWKIKITWIMNDQEYYFEKSIII